MKSIHILFLFKLVKVIRLHLYEMHFCVRQADLEVWEVMASSLQFIALILVRPLPVHTSKKTAHLASVLERKILPLYFVGKGFISVPLKGKRLN